MGSPASTGVSRWEFDAWPGQIRGCSDDGRVLMVLGTGPQFGERLAAAFSSAGGVSDPTRPPSPGRMLWPAC